MKKSLLSTILILAVSCVPLFGQQPEKATSEFVLHEWGVFTAPRDAEWLKQDMLVEWQSFPDFFHGVLPKRELNYRGPVTKPVIFFHGEGKQHIDLIVRFNDGHPIIWWPPAEHPADGAWYLADKNLGPPESMLRFAIELNEETGIEKPVPSDHWLNHLRAVKASPFTVHGSYGMRAMGDTTLSENFVYYDGLMKRPPAPIVDRTDDGISMLTESEHVWHDVIVIENSLNGEQTAVATIEEIRAGKRRTELAWQSVDTDGVKQIVNDFAKRLTQQGLNEDETQSLLGVWSDGLFHRSGITVIYRISQKTYDRWIPLHCNPEPKETVRVGLVVHHHLEPELEENVLKLVDLLGSEKFETRDRAHKQLLEIGGAAVSTIQRAAEDPNVERAARAQMIIKDLNTDDLMKQAIERLKEVTHIR